ncbi:post-transcriptional regulator [Paenibacillus methanolicus]|uniref:ComN-like post-transcriptional regulator n=1 Tax=Paenibacillus methanolicus TaxID=582686 RepID=A0A5S5C5S9_9BACL|nr:post-transcriptional regulator [Paenibacillus methanolicus]TYP73822.1 ComN-like post-transcriptional regulator [Paenibacillus methanolicus]
MTEEEWVHSIESLCESKAAEFRMIGYEHVTGKEIWECISEKYAKTGEPAMHQVVNDILSLKVTKFMNFLTISAYKGTHF